MRDLKSDIIHAIYQCSGVDNEKLVEVSNICDKFQSRLDVAEALKPSPNTGSHAICDSCKDGFVSVDKISFVDDGAVFNLSSSRKRQAGA